MSDWLMLQGDMRAVLADMEPDSVDAVICDPPYELTNGKRGGTGAASANPNNPAGRSRIGTGGGGFMGCEWDATGVSFDPETWRAALRVAKPGAHLAAFGGSRTWHRIAVAIEDAGWDIRDSLIWWYAQGFPKSLDVSKAIDAAETGIIRGAAGALVSSNGSMTAGNYERTPKGAPITTAAREWYGWGTALKPAFEPVILARKPLAGTVAANVLRYGTGAINVEAGRVGEVAGGWGGGGSALYDGGLSREGGDARPVVGRWPPNMLISHADACTEGAPCVEGCPAPMFGERMTTFPAFYAPKASRSEREAGCDALPIRAVDDREEGSAGAEHARAGARSPRRNIHPTVKPISVMRWLARLLCRPGGLILDPFAGSGTTGCAAVLEGFDFLGVELDPAHVAICEARIKHHAEQAAGRLL